VLRVGVAHGDAMVERRGAVFVFEFDLNAVADPADD
jgi:hypothetical protein